MNEPRDNDYSHMQTLLNQDYTPKIVRWIWWHFRLDPRFKIRVMAVWKQTRYFSFTEALHNTEFLSLWGGGEGYF